MGKRGPKPKWREFEWSPEFAYAIGLLATDGCLYNDGRHLSFVSQDIELLHNLRKCLKMKVRITFKTPSPTTGKRCPHVQWSDVALYQYLLTIGLTPNKSKTLGKLNIPPEFFFDFFRGAIDGDGSFYSYYDSRWRSSFMFYLVLCSASKHFVDWVRGELETHLSVTGHVTTSRRSSMYQLKYAKAESLKIIESMYYSPTVVCLARKRKKIEKAIQINLLTK